MTLVSGVASFNDTPLPNVSAPASSTALAIAPNIATTAADWINLRPDIPASAENV